MNYYIVGCMKFFQSKTLYFFFGLLKKVCNLLNSISNFTIFDDNIINFF